MPILVENVPSVCRHLKADQIMAKDPVCVHAISTIGEIKRALKTNHHSFPVLNKKEKFVGLMPRNFVIIRA